MRELAKCRKADLQIEDHGLLILDVEFEYDGGSAVQGMPIIVQGEHGGKFIKALMEAVGVERLSAMRNKSVWLTQRGGYIKLIEPLHKNEGTPLDIDQFNKKYKDKN